MHRAKGGYAKYLLATSAFAVAAAGQASETTIYTYDAFGAAGLHGQQRLGE
jgi:hypothetical protein